jgi:hypothetical protein
MGGDKSINEVLNQVLKLQAAKVAVGTPVRLREVSRDPMGMQPPPAELNRDTELAF